MKTFLLGIFVCGLMILAGYTTLQATQQETTKEKGTQYLETETGDGLFTI